MEELSMTSFQMAIYNGLYAIRPVIAAFYKDGLKIKDLTLEAKSNLLGHLLREIDGGLRDVYKLDNKKNPTGDGHKQSIVNCFGMAEDSALVTTYLEIAKQFNVYAHRSDKDISFPKDPSEIILLWELFEDVLYPLLGSFMGNTLRLDVLLGRDEPNAVADSCLTFILGNESKRTYFFQRLNKIGWLRPLYNQGVFDAKHNPEPIELSDKPGVYSFPYWYELSYITRIISQISDQQTEYWDIIITVIDSIIAYRKDDKTSIRNFRTNDMIVHLISFLPDRYLIDKYFDAIKTIIETEGTFGLFSFQNYLIPRLIAKSDKKNLLRCLDLIYSFHDNGSNYPKYTPCFDLFLIKPEIKKWNSDLCHICGIEGLRILLQKFHQVKNDPKLIFFASVDETDNQNRYQDEYSPKLIFSIIEYALGLTTTELRQVVEELLFSDCQISKRIAFHLIDKQYDQLKDIYWRYPSNPMNEHLSYPEIFRLLINNSKNFSENEQIKIISDIDKIEFQDDLDITQKQINYYKKRLAISLLPTQSSAINSYVNKISEVYPDEIENPGYDSYFGTSVYIETDTPTVDLESKDIPEIIELYKKIQPSPLPFGLNSYNLDKYFSNIVQKQIVKYTENIEILIESPSSMLRAWIWGLLSYIRQTHTIANVENVFTVINQVLQKEKFWKKTNSMTSNIELSILSDMLVLIGQMNLHNVSPLGLEEIINVLNTICKNKKITQNQDWDLRINSMYNRFDFKLIDSMIAVNHAYAKKLGLKENNRWIIEFKDIIDKGINSQNINYDLFFALGQQHHSIWYIDKSWMEANIVKIFLNDNSQNRAAAVSGFLMNYALADITVFLALLEKGVFENILQNVDEYDSITLQNIVSNILEGIRVNQLDDNVLYLLLKTDNKMIYTETLNFGSNLDLDDINIKFIKNVWGKFVEYYVIHTSDSMQDFCKNSYRWLGQIDTLDQDVQKWLMISAQNNTNQNFYAFVELLRPFFSTEPQNAGRILLELIKNADHIYYPNLPTLVEEVYRVDITLADEICDVCARKQEFSVSDIYKRYHS